MAVRAIRGAIQVPSDTFEALSAAVPRLLEKIFEANQVDYQDLISILFTATPDLVSDFPAAAARNLPLGDVPLICASEIAVPGALPRVIRVLVHAESGLSRAEIKHVYLDGAEALRRDIAQ